MRLCESVHIGARSGARQWCAETPAHRKTAGQEWCAGSSARKPPRTRKTAGQSVIPSARKPHPLRGCAAGAPRTTPRAVSDRPSIEANATRSTPLHRRPTHIAGWPRRFRLVLPAAWRRRHDARDQVVPSPLSIHAQDRLRSSDAPRLRSLSDVATRLGIDLDELVGVRLWDEREQAALTEMRDATVPFNVADKETK